ncbi:hypothetical protein LOT_0423 [Lentilactobacillus otakiensis DSM 19908 = JCM 15040]|uniref:Uncharacterized protein n=1 Tax=Lentilactobacillus otakiensis DSM 19908 = JCM 15040 TaxID=1423780 RepID=S4PNG9_9LACO|nr:hypothetical protein LOT_0423 [Lentilactobacillus otakiensis DSM 19908 = JCM 15040]
MVGTLTLKTVKYSTDKKNYQNNRFSESVRLLKECIDYFEVTLFAKDG